MTHLAFFENRKSKNLVKFDILGLLGIFLHSMGSESCLSYTGLVLPEHTSPDSDLVFLSEPQVIFDLNQPPMIFGASHVRLMDLQASWFVSDSEPPCILHWSSFVYLCQ